MSQIDFMDTLYNRSGSYVTIDESLLSSKGRYSLKVYVPSKPCNYEAKVWSMDDASN